LFLDFAQPAGSHKRAKHEPELFEGVSEPNEAVDRRLLDAALRRHSHQHLAIGLATVATHDRAERVVVGRHME
jgi:hypothetical protein